MTQGSKFRLSFTILALAVCSFGVAAQDSSLGGVSGPQGVLVPGQRNSSSHTVSGTVVDSITGEPISRALVQIGGQFAALTDHEGRFAFEGVEESILPWAMKPGYFSDRRFQNFVPNLSPEAGAEPIVLRLVPEAILTGTVTGADGGPLEGIQVELKMLNVQDGVWRWTQRQGTTTNSAGEYRFYELEAGKYAVATAFHADGLQDAEASEAYVPIRFPATAGTGAEAAIVLAAGDHREADLSPQVEKVFPVTGTVSGYGESRGVSFRVQTGTGEEVSPNSRFRAATGEFRMMLPSGRYSVTATAYHRDGRQRQQLQARSEITVPQGPVRGVSFALEPAATIPIDLDIEASNQEQSPSPPPGVGLVLLNADSEAVPSQIYATELQRNEAQPQDSPGRLRFDSVPPGRYLTSFAPQQPWYVSSASCGGVDLLREQLTIGGGAAGCSIRVVLRNDSGILHVTLREAAAGGQSNPANTERAFIYVLPVGDLARQPVVSSGSSPAYQGTPVAPGRYLVLALDHHEELAYRDPDAMRRYAALGEETTVSANGKSDVEIGVVSGAP